MAELDDLRNVIQCHPIIDNHAHNLLKASSAADTTSFPLETITSEAHGVALEQTPKTISHHIAVKQLAELFACEPTWEAVKTERATWVKKDYEGLVTKCLAGTHTLLLDDLLAGEDIVEPYTWHNQFTASDTKRIVRIEVVASQILGELWGPHTKSAEVEKASDVNSQFKLFRKRFEERIRKAMDDPEVVGFKSVICYRTGLDIELSSVTDPGTIRAQFAALGASFTRTLKKGAPFRIADKAFNNWLVIATMDTLEEDATLSKRPKKPIQFHTGLGDSDIDLVLANPAYLQPAIALYKNVEFVLLHSSYPYTQEAGYLASVYPNVHLDLGEVFPMVSKDAEESILRQAFDLAPTSRLLWSTDGHFHPETYWLSNKQFRDTLEKILVDYVEQGILTVLQAKGVVADILFNNSNKLYSLGLPRPKYKVLTGPSKTKPSTITESSKAVPDLDAIYASNPNLIVWVQFLDYTATVRCRMFPLRQFMKIVKQGQGVGITKAAFHLLQDDHLAPGGLAVGQFHMLPDLSSFSMNARDALSSNSATVMTFWTDEDGNPLEGCSRTMLQRIVTKCKMELSIDVLFGFEIEVCILKRGSNDDDEWQPLTQTHAWSHMTTSIRKTLPLLEEIVATLSSIGIDVQQFHAESAPGQFEFVLPPSTPVAAVDQLIKARQTICHVVEKHDLKATLLPRPYASAAGSASHAHFSITPSRHEGSFLAGIMSHFNSITAFSLSHDSSYARVAQGVWAGGEWITWGTQNREAPVRKIAPGHWEFKSVDGLANMYFAMAALIGAGYLGVTSKMVLLHQDCLQDASLLSNAQRAQLGITKRIARSLKESLATLEADVILQSLLGRGFVKTYCEVKRAESTKLAAMSEKERRQWLIDWY